MASYFSILAWKIPWTEDLGGLQSMGCKESDMTQHSSATTKKKIMPYMTTWINLEDIMLSVTSQNKGTNVV